jgi:hypothetical protein
MLPKRSAYVEALEPDDSVRTRVLRRAYDRPSGPVVITTPPAKPESPTLRQAAAALAVGLMGAVTLGALGLAISTRLHDEPTLYRTERTETQGPTTPSSAVVMSGLPATPLAVEGGPSLARPASFVEPAPAASTRTVVASSKGRGTWQTSKGRSEIARAEGAVLSARAVRRSGAKREQTPAEPKGKSVEATLEKLGEEQLRQTVASMVDDG